MFFTVAACIVVGFLVAILGAWKDTLWEQFSLRKFLRTPALTGIAGVSLVVIMGSPSGFWEGILYVLSAASLERLVVDSLYKGIRRKMPSKFLRYQRDTRWLRERISKLCKRIGAKAA